MWEFQCVYLPMSLFQNRNRAPNVVSNIANALTNNQNSLVDSLKESTMMKHQTLNNNIPNHGKHRKY